MPVPAIEDKPYARHIFDTDQDLSKEQAEEYLADLTATLAKHILPADYRLHCSSLLGLLLMRLDRPAEALPVLSYVAETTAHSGDWNNLGRVYLELNQLDQAVEYLTKAVEVMPDDESLLDRGMAIFANLAEALWRKEKASEAMAVAQQAIVAADPLDATQMKMIASLMAEMGLHGEAAEFLVRAIALRFGFELGEEQAVDVLRRLRGQYDEFFGATPKLRDSVAFVLAFEEAVLAHDEERPGNGDGTLAMFQATRPMRERAALATVEQKGGPSWR